MAMKPSAQARVVATRSASYPACARNFSQRIPLNRWRTSPFSKYWPRIPDTPSMARAGGRDEQERKVTKVLLLLLPTLVISPGRGQYTFKQGGRRPCTALDDAMSSPTPCPAALLGRPSASLRRLNVRAQARAARAHTRNMESRVSRLHEGCFSCGRGCFALRQMRTQTLTALRYLASASELPRSRAQPGMS
jgi:hypothetical protein